MDTRWIVVAIGMALPALIGCENACQQMCREFADIYDECGFNYGDAELKDCVQANRIVDKTRLNTVCEYGMEYNTEFDATNLRADLEASSDTGDICTTLEDWCLTANTCSL